MKILFRIIVLVIMSYIYIYAGSKGFYSPQKQKLNFYKKVKKLLPFRRHITPEIQGVYTKIRESNLPSTSMSLAQLPVISPNTRPIPKRSVKNVSTISKPKLDYTQTKLPTYNLTKMAGRESTLPSISMSLAQLPVISPNTRPIPKRSVKNVSTISKPKLDYTQTKLPTYNLTKMAGRESTLPSISMSLAQLPVISPNTRPIPKRSVKNVSTISKPKLDYTQTKLPTYNLTKMAGRESTLPSISMSLAQLPVISPNTRPIPKRSIKNVSTDTGMKTPTHLRKMKSRSYGSTTPNLNTIPEKKVEKVSTDVGMETTNLNTIPAGNMEIMYTEF